MPAKSESQKKLMKMVYAYKKGSLKLNKLPEDLATKIKDIAKDMTKEQLRHFFENIEPLRFQELNEIVTSQNR